MSALSDPGYVGCKGFDAKSSIDRLSVADTTAQEFFKSHVVTRTPAVFNDQIIDAKCTTHIPSLWSNTYLREKCGKCKVKVEMRTDGGRYGKGNEIKTSFGEFLSTVHEGRTYLTTQDLVYDDEGRPAIISPPLTTLEGDFPLTPALFDNLVVSNINLWFGYTPQYSTSGLHHDFHDNIYILLRGEKRFTLISPVEAPNLYTVGQISVVHPNGRINYEGQLPTKADGSDLRAETAMLASNRLQAVAERLAQDDAQDEQDLEDELEAALDDVLNAEMEGDDGSCDESESEIESGRDSEGDGSSGADGHSSDSEGDWDGQDDYVDSDVEAAARGAGSEEEGGDENSESSDSREGSESGNESAEDEEQEEEGGGCDISSVDEDEMKAASHPNRKRTRPDLGVLGKGLEAVLKASKASKDAGRDKSKKQRLHDAPAGQSSNISSTHNGDSNGGKKESSDPPDNFSRVDTDLPDTVLQEKFPAFAALKQRGAAVDVVLKAGQMLYIPAGWFHEVRSRSSGKDTIDESEYGGHLALNYWFHPPDGATYEHPYSSDFWKRDFEDRMKKQEQS